MDILFSTNDRDSLHHDCSRWLHYVNLFERAFHHQESKESKILTRSVEMQYVLRDEIVAWLKEHDIEYWLLKRSGPTGPLYYIRMDDEHAVEFKLRWF